MVVLGRIAKLLGLCVAGLGCAAVAVSQQNGLPALPSDLAGWQALLAQPSTWLLALGIVVAVVSGIASILQITAPKAATSKQADSIQTGMNELAEGQQQMAAQLRHITHLLAEERAKSGQPPLPPEEQAAQREAVTAILERGDAAGANAIAAIEEGNVPKAYDTLMAAARAAARTGAERYREAGALMLGTDTARALAAYQAAAALDPDDVWTHIFLARLHQQASTLALARQSALAARNVAVDERDSMVCLNTLGDIAVKEGDLAAARTAFTDALAIARRLAQADPKNSEWQRDLSVSYERLGDVAVEEGDLAAARTAFTDGLAIRQRLAQADPNNSGWQRDLSVSYTKLGDVAVKEGDLAAARMAFTDGLAIRQRLAQADPKNSGWQRDLSVSYEKLGIVAVAEGDLAAARTAFTDGLAIRQRLAQADPNNTVWQRDLSVSYTKLGEVAVAEGDLAAARTAFTDGLAIHQRLAQADPNNSGWQRDLSVSYTKLGDVAVAEGDLAAARTAFTDGLAIQQRLAKADPRNAGWQRDVWVSLAKLAQLPDSGVGWAQVVEAMEACARAGTLLKGDMLLLEQLRQLARQQ